VVAYAYDDAVTIDEAAATLGLSPQTLRNQIANGRLEAVKHGRDWWIEPQAIERYRERSRGQPGRKAKT
jgi:excisionase family DNA binding protein